MITIQCKQVGKSCSDTVKARYRKPLDNGMCVGESNIRFVSAGDDLCDSLAQLVSTRPRG